MSKIDSIIGEVQLLAENENDEIAGKNIYDAIYSYYISKDVLIDLKESIKQLDENSLTDSSSWLLFSTFEIITTDTYYNYEKRDQICEVLLPIYEEILKEYVAKNCFPLNSIIYLIANLIQMQRTFENRYHLIKRETQFENFKQINQYFNIIKIILPLLINEDILEQISKDDQNSIQLKWKQNQLSNHSNVTSTYTLWIIVKLILMFTKTDGDCLTMIKHEQLIKDTLLKSMKFIQDDNQLKLSFYVILSLLLNEDDIKNKFNNPKEVIIALTSNLKKVSQSDEENKNDQTQQEEDDDPDLGLITNGVYLVDVFAALKAFLQHDQVKDVFIEIGGLELLLELFEETLELTKKNDLLKADDLVNELKSDSELKTEEDIQNAQKIFNDFTQDFNNEVLQIFQTTVLLTLESLFAMSFNKQANHLLKTNEKFMSLIKNLDNETKQTSTNPNDPLRKVLDGLLWKLEQENQFKEQQKTTSNETNDQFDLMISYSWSDKPLVHEIYQYLTEQLNYKIWLDENQMAGSLCQAMAQAVEKSKFVLMCMSEKYKTSENCRNEAEYARERKKTIIPLIMKQVDRDGWLGFISAGKMYIDFDKQEFQTAVKLLQAEIERNQKEKGETIRPVQNKEKKSEVTAPIPTTTKLPSRPNTISNQYKKIPMESWNEQHVQDFLYDNNLDPMVLLTESMNGGDMKLLFEKSLKEQEFWNIFDRLNSELQKRHQQTFPLSVYLRFFNRIQKHISVSTF